MASDVGLTTSELSPSASFNSTRRILPRLERGEPAFLPKAAARPTSSESAAKAPRSMVGFVVLPAPVRPAPVSASASRGEGFAEVARLIHGFGLRIQGTLIPQDQGWADFRPKKNPENRKNLRKAPSRGSPLPLPARPRCPDGGTRRPPGAPTETLFWQGHRTCERAPDRWPSGGRCP